MSGNQCKKWSTQRVSAETHPNKGLGAHNYCRNPDGDSTTWCYTSYWGHWGQRRECNVGQPKPSCIGMCKMQTALYSLLIHYKTTLKTKGVFSTVKISLVYKKIRSPTHCVTRDKNTALINFGFVFIWCVTVKFDDVQFISVVWWDIWLHPASTTVKCFRSTLKRWVATTFCCSSAFIFKSSRPCQICILVLVFQVACNITHQTN